jgi:hypothetical protein
VKRVTGFSLLCRLEDVICVADERFDTHLMEAPGRSGRSVWESTPLDLFCGKSFRGGYRSNASVNVVPA